MELSIRLEQDKLDFLVENDKLNPPKVEKVMHLNLKAENNAEFEGTVQNQSLLYQNNMVIFIKGFKAVVQEEMQKSLDCISFIKEDMDYYKTELQLLRKQLHLETTETERERIQDKITANKCRLGECEEQILLIQERVLRLTEEFRVLCAR